jgi:Holliday junction resolvase RusA-like endonuclease
MKYEIEMKLPSLNDYVNVCRSNRYQASKFKRDLECEISWYLLKMPSYDNPIKLTFTWVEGNKKRDLDNVAYAKKHILDAMVKHGKLKDDNRNCVIGFTDKFEYSKDGTFKVIVEVEEVK